MNITQITLKVLNDLKLARMNAIASNSTFGASAKDILDCLENINTESFNTVKQYIDYQNGTIMSYRWIELKEMCNEISSKS